ncbi:hypothetical protein HanIR_Chr11g0516851 [Helianthus annuus]|nr:hypothetical protein HanIR_Chr11g0516851 [Helianthus annuus]
MIYKTKQITRFMTKHFSNISHESRFHKTNEMMHRTYQDILRRTCALVT